MNRPYVVTQAVYDFLKESPDWEKCKDNFVVDKFVPASKIEGFLHEAAWLEEESVFSLEDIKKMKEII